jgi:hypothetical protein
MRWQARADSSRVRNAKRKRTEKEMRLDVEAAHVQPELRIRDGDIDLERLHARHEALAVERVEKHGLKAMHERHNYAERVCLAIEKVDGAQVIERVKRGRWRERGARRFDKRQQNNCRNIGHALQIADLSMTKRHLQHDSRQTGTQSCVGKQHRVTARHSAWNIARNRFGQRLGLCGQRRNAASV